MTNTVLLARPHPFIAVEMKPFLEHCGFAAAKLENMADLAVRSASCAGAVISLALSSSVGDSAAEVFMRLRRCAPHVPVLFAAMLAFDKSQGNLARLAQLAGIEATILGVAAENENAGGLGKPETFLYISKDDLADTARREMASRMVRRHFR